MATTETVTFSQPIQNHRSPTLMQMLHYISLLVKANNSHLVRLGLEGLDDALAIDTVGYAEVHVTADFLVGNRLGNDRATDAASNEL